MKRYLVLFIANLIGLYLISFGLDFTFTNLYKVVLFIFFISIFNAILWPLITKIYMPILVWTFGIGSLILNGGIFAFFGPYFGLNITGWGIILAPLTIALITIVLSTILSLEDDGAYYQAVLRELKGKEKAILRIIPV
ncbi:phage holin family protein [uncultured Methanobrevibacter sp.]|uniref:phage holin family protein n=1 Tax=uncultured Methanobrevibacter sp. TaxID=253161 RepID=UPI0025E03140|nr:phage holin family protein [uncultured Methanobrevibacter sp.]